jgi:hypothetical protein
MATRAERLYKDDFYAWTRDQAAALRRLGEQRWNGPLDLLHLAEEVEDLAASSAGQSKASSSASSSISSSSSTRRAASPGASG